MTVAELARTPMDLGPWQTPDGSDSVRTPLRLQWPDTTRILLLSIVRGDSVLRLARPIAVDITRDGGICRWESEELHIFSASVDKDEARHLFESQFFHFRTFYAETRDALLSADAQQLKAKYLAIYP